MKKMQRRSKVDKDGKPLDKDSKKDKDGNCLEMLNIEDIMIDLWTGERVGGGDNDSYCDSEASLDDGSCYDNLEDAASPPPADLGHQTLDLRHQEPVPLRVTRYLLTPSPKFIQSRRRPLLVPSLG